MVAVVYGLCGPSRHEISMEQYAQCLEKRGFPPTEIEGYLFGTFVDQPLHFALLEQVASDFLTNRPEDSHIFLIVTGLGPALASTIKAWHTISLTHRTNLHLLHWDRDTGNYRCQSM